jgi:DNA ligase 4
LVLKVRQDPYVSFHKDVRQIKLKKDYIPGLGDSADLIVVGGHRDAKDVQMLHMGNLSWTTFYLACLVNKDQVRRFDVKPRFRVVSTVGRPCLSVEDLRQLNDHGKFHLVPFARR